MTHQLKLIILNKKCYQITAKFMMFRGKIETIWLFQIYNSCLQVKKTKFKATKN